MLNEKKSIIHRFLGNSGWMMGQQIYNMLLQLVVGSLSARYLGPSNYGLINYGASIIAFFSIVCRLGLDSVIINEMIKTPERRGKYLGSALCMRLVMSVVSLFMIMAIVRVLEPNNSILYVITLMQAFAVILQTYEVFTYWFQLNLKMKYVSIAVMLAQTVVGAWRIFLLASKASVVFFALSSSIQYLVCGVVVVFFFVREKTNVKLEFSKKDAKFLLKNSYHFIISGLAVTFYSQIDKIMIGRYISSEAVGFYTAAATIAAMWEFVPNALINSARPLIISARKDSYKKYIERFQQLLLVVSLLSIVVSVVVTAFGKIAVSILYGNSYLEAVAPLAILVWSTGFAMIGTARGIWIVAEGYNKYTKYYIFVGAGVNFVLNYFFIRYWGIVGASIATLISQVVVAFVSPLLFKKTRNFVKIYFDSYKYFFVMLKMAKKLVVKN
mgnify:CR=1 FL=1